MKALKDYIQVNLEKVMILYKLTVVISFLFLSHAHVSHSQDDFLLGANANVQLILDDLCDEASLRDSIKQLMVNYTNEMESIIQSKDSTKLRIKDSLQKLLNNCKNRIVQIENDQEYLKELLLKNKNNINGCYTLSFKGVDYQIFVLNDSNLSVNLHHKDSMGNLYRSLGKVRSDLLRNGKIPYMITNAGMYTKSNDPEGLYIENGKELFAIDLDSSKILLNFYMHPNGVFYIDSLSRPHVCTSQSFVELNKDPSFSPLLATQSGPMLRINGEMHHRFNWGSTSRKIRSGVGVYYGICVFAITRGYSNFYDFASFFSEVIDCKNALFLDGAISEMYDPNHSFNELGGNFGPILSVSKSTDRNYYHIKDPDGWSYLRNKPDGQVIRKVFVNEYFEVCDDSSKWFLVMFENGDQGYIHESRVEHY